MGRFKKLKELFGYSKVIRFGGMIGASGCGRGKQELPEHLLRDLQCKTEMSAKAQNHG